MHKTDAVETAQETCRPFEREGKLPPARGLYDPRYEHDACGIGFVAHIEGRRSQSVLQMALEALANHSHRGAVADDRKTGDGAGILTQLPYEFFQRIAAGGRRAAVSGRFGRGQLFLFRQGAEDRDHAPHHPRGVRRVQAGDVGLPFRARQYRQRWGAGQASRPWMEQVLVRRTPKRAMRATTSSGALPGAQDHHQPRAPPVCNASTSPASAAAPSSTRAWCWLRSCRILPGPERFGLHHGDRRLSPARHSTNTSHLGARPALPHDLPQRRD